MPSEPIISVSGLRGVVGESLTPELVTRYVAAFAAELPPGDVLVGYDGRATGPMVVSAVVAALAASGRHVRLAGVAATPTVGVLVSELGLAGAVQVSASHNPAEYNGLKLFGGDGRVLSAAKGAHVKRRYTTETTSWSSHSDVGSITQINDTTSIHLERVLDTVDVPRIRAERFRVLLDAGHGSGSVLGKRLLEELGCIMTLVGGEPDGRFEHVPEPTAENLQQVAPQVVASESVVGFCQDPDADRLALIDEQGRYIGEEKTLPICVDHWLHQHPGAVVTNCSTSRMTQDIAEKHGCEFHHSAVGEANVVERMIETRAAIGGEGNGGVIHPHVGWVRDSFVGMALLLDAMATQGKSLSELADTLPHYDLCKTKVALPADAVEPARQRLQQHWPDAEASLADGLRLDWSAERKWLLVRASNTEPIVRIFAEAKSAEEASSLCDEASQIIATV